MNELAINKSLENSYLNILNKIDEQKNIEVLNTEIVKSRLQATLAFENIKTNHVYGDILAEYDKISKEKKILDDLIYTMYEDLSIQQKLRDEEGTDTSFRVAEILLEIERIEKLRNSKISQLSSIRKDIGVKESINSTIATKSKDSEDEMSKFLSMMNAMNMNSRPPSVTVNLDSNTLQDSVKQTKKQQEKKESELTNFLDDLK